MFVIRTASNSFNKSMNSLHKPIDIVFKKPEDNKKVKDDKKDVTKKDQINRDTNCGVTKLSGV